MADKDNRNIDDALSIHQKIMAIFQFELGDTVTTRIQSSSVIQKRAEQYRN